jgi:esterase/lipase
MSFLTDIVLQDRLTHKIHYETVEQHKYARLAMAAYYYENQEYVSNTLFAPMSELDDFVLDNELSTQEHSVFYNETTNEVVISYRGTTTLDDVKTDSHILMSREKNTERYKRSEAVFEKTRDKYDGPITITGHSLGGGVSLHIAEKFDTRGYSYNPAISATQVFSKDHYNNKSKQTIYRTKLDPVSIGGEIIADHQPNREVVTVGNDPSQHAHALENFYNDKAKRTEDNTGYNVKKETLRTTIDRHKSAFKRLYDAWKKAQDIEEYLDSINADTDILTKLPKALPKAWAMAKRGASPRDFSNETARSLNPFFGFVPDIDFQWDDRDVITPLYRLGQAMRTTQRRRTDNLLALQPEHPHQQYTQQDQHHLLSSAGVRYEEVFGQDMRQRLPPRRRPTEGYQVIDPLTMEGARLAITQERLREALASSPAIQRNVAQFQDTGSTISDPMSSSYVPPSQRAARRRPTEGYVPLPADLPKTPSEIASVISRPM